MKKAVRTAKGTTQIIWLGVASVVGVAVLAWLGSMFLGRSDGTAMATEVAVSGEMDPAEIDPPVHVVNRGSWIVFEDRDPMDDSPIVIANLVEDAATLMAGCKGGQTSVFVAWKEYLGTGRAITVTHRLPPAPAQRASWIVAAGATAPPDPIAFLRDMVAETTLVMRTTPYMSAPVTATFDLTGAEEAIGKVADACGWQVVEG